MKREIPPAGKKTRLVCTMKWADLYACLPLFVVCLSPGLLAEPLNQWTAWVTGTVLGFLGLAPSVQGPLVSAGGFSIRMITECTALFPALLFSSLVIAQPASLRSKTAGLCLGIPILFAANQVRLLAAFLAGMKGPLLFEYVHVYMGQVFMMVAVLWASAAWFRSQDRRGERGNVFWSVSRFALFSCPLFLFWLAVNRQYAGMLDGIISSSFSLFGYDLFIPRTHGVYYHTFNVVPFIALIFSSPAGEDRWRAKGLLIGLIVLCLGHLSIRICNILFSAFMVMPAVKAAAILHMSSQYLLPFLLWLLLPILLESNRSLTKSKSRPY